MTNIIDPNASVSVDRSTQALEALKSGDYATMPQDESVVTAEDLESGVVEDNGLDSLFGSGDSNADEANDEEASLSSASGDDTQSSTESGDVEELIVKGADGKRKKIKVDYSNKQQIKQNALKAAGMRKFQAERDAALREVEALRGSQEKAENFDVLSEAYEVGGPEAVIRAMLGDEQGQQWLEQFAERYSYKQSASEDELKYLNAQEQAERQARELEAIKRRQEEYEKRVTEKQEAAAVAELQSTVNVVFDKYRFAGKLGDASQEHDLDETIWTRATNELKKYEEQGIDITRDMADKAFRRASEKLRKLINVQSEKKANRKVKQKKDKALETAQVTAKRGQAANVKADDARSMIRNGNYVDFFKNFGKNIKI